MASSFAASHIQLVLAAIVTAAVVWVVVSTAASYHRLRHIPGPWLARFSQLWLLNVTSKGDLYLAMEGVIEKYGRMGRAILEPAMLSSNRLTSEDRP
ncbi:hypothetical protein CLCR_11071 [Cladophialophora carrionii]|uniref:Cytochrome P450 n=1 Tax=Cladophialophora carrionii TaxID=86049 RepID=A0A1C1CV59_9EURO|nr:hypothetical protein CLCR_11071 [Cladophialophora carrionii]